MGHLEIIERCSRYEAEHAVETYRCYDWHVWPLLRIWLSYEAVFLPEGKVGWQQVVKNQVKRLRLAWYLEEVLKRFRARRFKNDNRQHDFDNHQSPTAPGREVVLLTLSGRRQWMEDCYYEIYSDPVVEALEEKKIQSLIWERGEERYPRCSPSAWITRELALEMSEMPHSSPIPQPVWFGEFADFARRLLGRTVSWAEAQARIRFVQQTSLIFEKWLNKVSAKLLISICWYDAEVIAATLAAHRLGIVSVDLQHGLQGNTHMAYSGWNKAPAEGYETVPDIFACWGKEFSAGILADNPAFSVNSRTVVTGNLWLNKWCEEGFNSGGGEDVNCLKGKVSGFDKVILVTLQSAFGFEQLVLDAINGSPPEWFWLVRLHPGTPLPASVEIKRKLAAKGKGVDFELASKLPLYFLLQLADVHITGHSTTAIEALCFGVPTITLTDVGAETFKQHLDAGVMHYAEDPLDLVAKLGLCESISAEKCRAASEDVFAPKAASDEGMAHLLSIARICLQS